MREREEVAPALRHLYDAANPTRREYDGFMDVISARAAIGYNIGEEVDLRIIFLRVHIYEGKGEKTGEV